MENNPQNPVTVHGAGNDSKNRIRPFAKKFFLVALWIWSSLVILFAIKSFWEIFFNRV